MDTTLIVKILPTKQAKYGGKRTVGTGYPIGKNLVLTARHVVVFPERDETTPITVEWPDLGHKDENAKIVFDGGVDCDVAILECQIPPQAQVSPLLLVRQPPVAHVTWESFGYPAIGKDEDGGDVRKKISALGKFHSPDSASHEISLTSESDALEKAGWRGISGAPVFHGRVLYAVITSTPTNRAACFNAVSIPYLLATNKAFREVVGCIENNETQQFFLAECRTYLASIKDSPLFAPLTTHFVGRSLESSAETLLQHIQTAVERNPALALEQLRLICEPVMKANHAHTEQVRVLLCWVLGLIAVDGQIDAGGVHHLAVSTRMMVEVSLAAHYKVRPELVHKQSTDPSAKVAGRYAIDDECLPEVGWNPVNNANTIADAVQVAVTKAHHRTHGQKPQHTLTTLDWEDLNETLLTRRKGENPQLIRMEVATSNTLKETHPLCNDDVCKALHDAACLPDLPIVRYGSGVAANEGKLRAQVNEFFRIIQQYS